MFHFLPFFLYLKWRGGGGEGGNLLTDTGCRLNRNEKIFVGNQCILITSWHVSKNYEGEVSARGDCIVLM